MFGIAALAATALHPVFGHLADRVGGRRLTFTGVIAMALRLPVMSLTRSFETAVAFYLVQAITVAIVVTPSLAFMAEAISSTGVAFVRRCLRRLQLRVGAGPARRSGHGWIPVRTARLRHLALHVVPDRADSGRDPRADARPSTTISEA